MNADSTEQAGYEAARALLAHGRSFDAVFAASDLIAIGAMRALQDAGLRVPADVAVVGFDGTPMARFCNPPLTTVVQDTTTAGELLVQALLAQVRGEDAVSLMLQPTLDVRASSIA